MGILKNIKSYVEFIKNQMLSSNKIQHDGFMALIELKDLILNQQTTNLQVNHKNPLNNFGNKCFSQSDEDGITLEILRRINIKKGFFVELGVGDGLENNTLILSATGWSGFWVGSEELVFDYSKSTCFNYIKTWLTLENISQVVANGMKLNNIEKIDVLSMDLDGNDIYYINKLLSEEITPSLVIVEYNAKFIPPITFQIDYDPEHKWSGDDYFGAALANFVEIFEKYKYKLVCCNSHTGANAFFVKNEYKEMFNDVPNDILDIYVPPRYYLYTNHGHKQSVKVVEKILNR